VQGYQALSVAVRWRAGLPKARAVDRTLGADGRSGLLESVYVRGWMLPLRLWDWDTAWMDTRWGPAQ